MPFSTITPDPSPSGPGQFDSQGNINTIQWNNLIAILEGTSSDKLPNFYPLQTANDTDDKASIGPDTETPLQTYTGKGMIIITVWGDGDTAVEIHYIIDGGTETLFTTSDQRLLAPLVFSESLEILAKNTGGSAANHSTVQCQGTYQ